jgi:hypothetical protein
MKTRGWDTTCSTQGKKISASKFRSENLKGGDLLKYLKIGGNIILKRVLKYD